jgi:hypothetical protein
LGVLNRRIASWRGEKPMHLGLNEFIDEQKKGLAELLANLSKSRVAAARSAARQSAARIKELNGRVRALARSGVRLTAVSQDAAQGLIELQADIVNTALTEAAAQIERLAYTESVREFARQQAEVLQAARQRIVDDMTRAVAILKEAAGDARKAVAKSEAPAKTAAAKKKASAARTRAGRVTTQSRAKPTARTRSGARQKRASRKSPRR